MTLLMTGNEFSNVNCKGPQGKGWGCGGTESPGWSLQRVGRGEGGRGGGVAAGGGGMKHVFGVLIPIFVH